MKKITAMLLVLVMAVSLFAGCNSNQPAETPNETTTVGSALEVLENTWAQFPEDEQFYVYGGAMEDHAAKAEADPDYQVPTGPCDYNMAYAEGLGNMTIGGSGGGVAGDMIGLGVGMAAASTVAPQLGEMMKGFAPNPTAENPTDAAKCIKCGATLPANAKFCLECGEKVMPPVPENMVVCPNCGNTVAKGKFCPECGHKFITVCPKCGKETVPGAKFCLECGEKL